VQVFNGNSRQINHDVALVGWDDAKGAWLLRNSWGDWCDGGYCWIAYGANCVGTEPVFATVPSPEPPPAPPVVVHLPWLAIAGVVLVLVLVAVVFYLGRRSKK
jgi:hypothetical protein